MKNVQEDPRVIRTRTLIIDAFFELIKKQGFESISIKDLSERATLNRATFYRHFPDKYALLEVILQQMMENKGFEKIKEQDTLDENTFTLLIDAFIQLIDALRTTFGRNYQSILSLTEHQVKDQLIEMVHSLSPLNRRDHNKMIATMLVMSVHSATCSWINGNKVISREAFLETILPFLTGAMTHLNETTRTS